LRVHERVAVDLARRGEEEAGALVLGQPERVLRAAGAHLEDLDRDPLEVGGRRRRRQVHDGVDVTGDVDVVRHVVVLERERRVADQVLDVAHRTRDEVVDGDDLVAARQQRAAQVRGEEPRSAGDDDAGH
jgi:hypothetical protein